MINLVVGCLSILQIHSLDSFLSPVSSPLNFPIHLYQPYSIPHSPQSSSAQDPSPQSQYLMSSSDGVEFTMMTHLAPNAGASLPISLG